VPAGGTGRRVKNETSSPSVSGVISQLLIRPLSPVLLWFAAMYDASAPWCAPNGPMLAGPLPWEPADAVPARKERFATGQPGGVVG
jgi:hypothetical protein